MGVVACTNRVGAGYRRPVLIVQSNAFNQSRIGTVVIVVIISNLALAEAPGNVRISKAESALMKASVVNSSQIMTVDKQLFTDRVRALPATIMRSVDEGLRLVLAL